GNLVLATPAGDLTQHAPVLYQEYDTGRRDVAGRYVLLGKGQVGFAVEAHDPTRPLVIDPILTYQTFLGGSGDDAAYAVATDSTGAVYLPGSTASLNSPTQNPLYSFKGASDVFVAKVNAAGTGLVYSTYIGSTSTAPLSERGLGIAVNASGEAHVVGAAD